jgi:uncharacterized protein (DUF305 family)
MNQKTPGPVALLLAAALALGGCGSDGGSTATPSHSSTSHDMSSGMPTTHNDQDVTFARQMIPHHQQAIVMARMAETRADSAQVRQLARQIKAAQGPEIRTMAGWLEDWDAEQPGSMSGMGGMGGVGGHGSDHMPGMMSSQDMRDLRQADGPGFDRMFLEGMIAHHRGAVRMAEAEISQGENPDAVALARSIRSSQTEEIQQMQQMLGS